LEGSQKVFEKDLGAKVQEVRRLIEQQQVWFVEQQSRELDTGLPAAREVLHGGLEHSTFDFEFPGHFAAFPVRLCAISHEEFQGRFAWEKRVVLPQVPDLEFRVTDDLAGIEFVIPEDAFEEGGFSGSVSTDETDFGVPA
jgi:hypothetical protein